MWRVLLSSYSWKRGIFSGGKAREVSRNLQADRYMSKSAWEKFTGPFLARVPRTTLAGLGDTHKKPQEKVACWKSILQDVDKLINKSWIKSDTYFELSLPDSKVLSRRTNMRIWKSGKVKVLGFNVSVCPVMKARFLEVKTLPALWPWLAKEMWGAEMKSATEEHETSGTCALKRQSWGSCAKYQ